MGRTSQVTSPTPHRFLGVVRRGRERCANGRIDLGSFMTSSKKKHHPPAARTAISSQRVATPATKPAEPKPIRTTTNRQWTIRVIAVVGIIAGGGMALIGAGPDILGGYGKLLLMVPGLLIAAGSCIAFVETTSQARSLRRGRR